MQIRDIDWKFTISNPNALNMEEIASTLDENRMVAVTTTKDPTKCCCVFVHKRIMDKAHHTNFQHPLQRYDGGHTMTSCAGHTIFVLRHAKTVKDILDWVQDVRAAEWTTKENITVHVRYPEI